MSISVHIGDNSVETGKSIENKLCERGTSAFARWNDYDIIIQSIGRDSPDIAVLDISDQNDNVVAIMKKVHESGAKGPIFRVTSSYDNELIKQ